MLQWLTVIFIAAKIFLIAPVATWSWLMVFSPLLIEAGIWILIAAGYLWFRMKHPSPKPRLRL